MKRGLTLVALMGMFLSASVFSYAKELKMGYLNVLEVFDSYKKTADYDKQLEKLQEEKQKPFNDMADELKKLKEKMDMVKDSEKEALQKKIAEKADGYQKKEKEAFAELKKARDEKMKEIVDDINAAVKKYAQDNKYDFVLNETMVVYGDEKTNITKAILDSLNAQYIPKK